MTATTNANNHSMSKYCKRFRLCNGNWEFLGDLTRQSSTGASHDDFAWTVSQSQMRPATPNPPSNHRLNISVEGLSRGRLRARKARARKARARKDLGKEGIENASKRRRARGEKQEVRSKRRAAREEQLEKSGQSQKYVAILSDPQYQAHCRAQFGIAIGSAHSRHRPEGGQPFRDVAARTAGAEHPTTVFVGCGA